MIYWISILTGSNIVQLIRIIVGSFGRNKLYLDLAYSFAVYLCIDKIAEVFITCEIYLPVLFQLKFTVISSDVNVFVSAVVYSKFRILHSNISGRICSIIIIIKLDLIIIIIRSIIRIGIIRHAYTIIRLRRIIGIR